MFWHIYFWAFSILVIGTAVVRTVLYFAKPGSVSALEVVECLPSLGVVIALYGYIHHLVLGAGLLWAALAIVVSVFYVISLRGPKTREAVAKLGLAKTAAMLGASFLFSLPAYGALVCYAVRLW